tara:strand:- start:5050 stop:5937 length:888 start_codon:yes stop_codon:yes gene_type:complete
MRTFTHHDDKKNCKVGGALLSLAELRAIPGMDPETVNEMNRGMFTKAMGNFKSPSNDPSFYGTSSAKVLAKRADGDWGEGATKLRQLSQGVLGAATTLGVADNRRRPAWSDQGDEVCLDRLLGGQLDQMWRTTRRDGQGITPIVSIVCGWGGLAMRSAEQLFWSGATAVVAAHILEEHGYSVEIIAANCADQDDGTSVAAIRLKNSDTPLEMMSVAASACFGGVFRTLGFAAKCLQPHVEVNWGYGSTADPLSMEISKWPLEGEPVAVGNVYSREVAIEKIKEILHSVETGLYLD